MIYVSLFTESRLRRQKSLERSRTGNPPSNHNNNNNNKAESSVGGGGATASSISSDVVDFEAAVKQSERELGVLPDNWEMAFTSDGTPYFIEFVFT